MRRKPDCPWCHQALDSSLARNLGTIAQPCPHCGKPIRISLWQTLFVALTMAPLVALILWLCSLVYSNDSKLAVTVIFIAAIVFVVYLQRHIPCLHGPAKGPE